ncbi:hypothetical protein BDR07DRAFT_1265381, partial [Suillus spraguei]
HWIEITHYKEDWKLMFDNARTYNQEGSWVYIGTEEMEEVFHSTLERLTAGTGLAEASSAPGGPSSSAAYDSALIPMDEDEQLQQGRAQSIGCKQVISDDEYLMSSDD